MRKTKTAALVGILLCVCLALFQIYRYTLGAKVIGTVSGAEREYITIDDKTYMVDNSTGFSSADKGKFLGTTVSGNATLRLYSVKDDGENRYLYCLWDWEGRFYQLVD